MNEIVTLGVALIVLIFATAGGVVLLTWLRTRRQGYPYEDEIEAALLPFVYQAIMAAYRASEYALDEFGRRLAGEDKAGLARAAYAMLPAVIVIRGVALPIRNLVTEAQFVSLVEDAFDGFLVWYNRNCDGFEAAVQEWSQVNAQPDGALGRTP